MIKLTIPGRPIPYTRMTQKSKYVNKSAIKYLAYKDSIGWEAKAQKIKSIGNIEFEIEVIVYLAGGGINRMGSDGDIDNYVKAALDGLQGIAFNNDRMCFKCIGEKIIIREVKQQRMEITIKEYELK